MALTSLWKMLCCSTWLSTRGRSVPKLWLLSLSWRVGGETPGQNYGLGADLASALEAWAVGPGGEGMLFPLTSLD